MFNFLKVRLNQGCQTITDIKNAKPPSKFRGLPVVSQQNCPDDCISCIDICPTKAVSVAPLSIDLNSCLFCPDCEVICERGLIKFTNEINLGATDPSSLIISPKNPKPRIAADRNIEKLFKRSLKLRSISAGGCNGCELELNALSNVNFDIGRFGVDFVASPRHADGIVLTGPLTKNMTYAFEETLKAVPEPKIIILAGACALSGGLFWNSPAIDRTPLLGLKPNLYIPGCPIHPLAFANAILTYLGR
ncbi:NADH ubiquinone oxidoreductase, 20 kDa subunit [Candidatus Magnetoovum chiemensis]|nr:NADH ubiquinone oxidoreductase, 20 kDa subunit [Candidatus Magnetoovum chiemensis]